VLCKHLASLVLLYLSNHLAFNPISVYYYAVILVDAYNVNTSFSG